MAPMGVAAGNTLEWVLAARLDIVAHLADRIAARTKLRRSVAVVAAALINLALFTALVLVPRQRLPDEAGAVPIFVVMEPRQQQPEEEEPRRDTPVIENREDAENAARESQEAESRLDRSVAADTPTATALPTLKPERKTQRSTKEGGIVAIYCPDAFENADKAAECAGRVQIRSGWTPPASLREDWGRIAKELRRQVVRAPELGVILGPEEAERVIEERRVRELFDARRGVAREMPTGADDAWRRSGGVVPDIGPPPVEPSWTLRAEPTLTDRQIRELRDGALDKKPETIPEKDPE